jgi:hypothetical protein
VRDGSSSSFTANSDLPGRLSADVPAAAVDRDASNKNRRGGEEHCPCSPFTSLLLPLSCQTKVPEVAAGLNTSQGCGHRRPGANHSSFSAI